MWHSGIDQHKQYCVITTYGPDGPCVKQARVPSTALALQQYFAGFPGPHRAVVESTGAWYWLFIANALKQYYIGLEETDDGIWSIYFGTVLLAKVDERDMIIRD